MPASALAPHPYDVLLDGRGYLLARDKSGAVRLTERAPTDPSQQESGEQTIAWRGFSGGVGLRQDTGTAEGRQTLWRVSAAAVGGGADGSWGSLILPPKQTVVTVNAAHPIRAFAAFGGKYYLASDNKVYESVSGLWNDATTSYTGPTGTTIRKLVSFQGTYSVPLLFAAVQGGPYKTFDGTTWRDDNSGFPRRTGIVKSVLWTNNAGASWVDITAVMTDGDNTTDQDLSGFGGPATDWILLGFDRPFEGATIEVGAGWTNANAVTMSGDYWNGTGWSALSSFVDGTASGGKTLNLTGQRDLTWARPTGWVKAPVSAISGLPSLYYVRLKFSGTLDATTHISEVWNTLHLEEADSFATFGRYLMRAFDHNRFGWTDQGGIWAPTWYDATDPMGSYDGTIVDMAAAQNAVVVKRSTDLVAINPDGTTVALMPDLFRTPSPRIEEESITAWLGQIWLSAGRAGYVRYDPLSGAIETVGPERFVSGEGGTPPRITAAVGDRTHFLYAAGLDAAGQPWLLKQGSLRQGINSDGQIEWIRHDGWHQVAPLGLTTVLAAEIYMVGSNPTLVFGDDAGKVCWITLPSGVSPLESGSGYQYAAGVDGYADLPMLRGSDATRAVECHAATIIARGLSPGSVRVGLATRAPYQTNYQLQATWDDATDEPRKPLPVPFAGYGMDVRLILNSGNASATPIIDVVAPHLYQDTGPSRRLLEAVVLADAHLADRRGRPLPMRAADWRGWLESLARERKPVRLVKPDGTTDTVVVRAISAVEEVSDPRFGRRQAVTLLLASAA